MSSQVKTIPSNHRQDTYFTDIRKKYREALIAVGKSPDYHIDDLDFNFLINLKSSPARDYLLRVKRHYIHLDEKQREIFVKEVLEYGRHYNFWFLGRYQKRKDYVVLLKQTLEGVRACF